MCYWFRYNNGKFKNFIISKNSDFIRVATRASFLLVKIYFLEMEWYCYWSIRTKRIYLLGEWTWSKKSLQELSSILSNDSNLGKISTSLRCNQKTETNIFIFWFLCTKKFGMTSSCPPHEKVILHFLNTPSISKPCLISGGLCH